MIIAGNKTVENAAAIGLEDVTVVQTDGKRIVAVQRMDLDLEADPMARELAIADNRSGDLNMAWDPDVLKDLAGEIDLSPFFTDKELKEIGALTGPTPEVPEPEIERAEELLKKWQTERDQIWSIPSKSVTGGAHRIMCGDSTTEADVGALMGAVRARMAFTDPPWNVAIGQDSNPRHRQREGLQNDSMSSENFCRFLGNFATQMSEVVDGDVYCVLGASEWPNLDRELRSVGYHWSATIIWVKDIFVLGRSKYHRRYEPIWYGWHKDGKSSFGEARDLDDVWEIDRPRVSEEHPTMKPVALPARAISNSSAVGDVVYEPFGGGGSTMAAEQMGRICYGMELDPKYVAVMLQRMADMGLKPELVTERCPIAVPA